MLMKKIACFGLALTWMVTASAGWCQYPAQPRLGIANVQFQVRLLSPISTETSKKGDLFNSQILSPPGFAGGFIEGRITQVKKAEHRKKAVIHFQFEQIVLSSLWCKSPFPDNVLAELKPAMTCDGWLAMGR